MFYRLSNLGASPFRPNPDTEHLFLSILSNLCISHTRWWHPCWLKVLETKYWWQFEDFDDRLDTSKTRGNKKSLTKRFCYRHPRSVNITITVRDFSKISSNWSPKSSNCHQYFVSNILNLHGCHHRVCEIHKKHEVTKSHQQHDSVTNISDRSPS